MATDRRSLRDQALPAAKRIETLRARRVKPEFKLTIEQELQKIEARLSRLNTSAGPIQQAWHRIIPHELACRTSIEVAGTELRVRVEDSSTRFALDRLLRAGAELDLIQSFPIPIKKIRLINAGRR
ncbi:MAG TPA: hypothetical protein ENJ00_10960 [Phycisphaerales bacterium]|nr:hypothetical protein [Phycisphaerales bacterium]